MGLAGRRRTQVVVGFLAIVATVSVLVALLGRMSRNGGGEILTWSKSPSPRDKSVSVISTSPSPTPSASPDLPSATPPLSNAGPTSPTPVAPTPSPAVQIPEGAEPNNLIIPVAGVRPDQLHDTYSESRSEGRVHDAIDIPAPQGTPVLAAADGTIVKLFHSERGGTTIYQLSTDNRFVYYYAHLDRYAEGLTEGHFAKQGETIAYVGDSGNAGAGNYHLHFSIALISDPKHYWQGVNINPYPLLKK
jgi:peptidoglycan LD-endopeptidase LytH